jgi:hypothetical protein
VPVTERFVIRPEDVGYEPVDDEMLVIDFVSSDYYLLNASGAAVWRALADAPRTVDELAMAFGGLDPASRPDDVRRDLESFLAALTGDGLLARTDDDRDGEVDAAIPELASPYVVPRFEKFGTLERLMLAGE